MFIKKVGIIALSLVITGQQVVFAHNFEKNSELERLLKDPVLQGPDGDRVLEMERFISRYRESTGRVDSCPLDSNQYRDIFTKIDTIRALFRDNCLDSDQERLSEILQNARSIQDSLNTYRDQQSPGSGDDNDDSSGLFSSMLTQGDTQVGGVTVNGEQIANVFNNINSIFLNGQCQIDDRTFLAQTADIIQSFAQMGLLVPNQNGLIVSGGGLAIASILRVIDNIFSVRFDFENIQDRQTFVKLNCAFYDLRNDIRETGMLDVPTQTHRRDLEVAIEFMSYLEEIESRLKSHYEDLNTAMIDYRENQLEGSLTFLKDFERHSKNLFNMVKVPLDGHNQVPAETQKMRLIQTMGMQSSTLYSMVEEYIERGFSDFEVMDRVFLREIERFMYTTDPSRLESLMELDALAFDQTHRAQLVFHFERVIEGVTRNRNLVQSQWMNETQVFGQSIAKLFQDLGEFRKAHIEQIYNLKNSLEVVINRIQRVLDTDEYRARQDSTENLVYILQQYDEITSQIYGKWGYEFVDYVTNAANRENRDFNKKFKIFADDHLEAVSGGSRFALRSQSELSDLDVIYACQDALPFRRSWRLADGLVRQGYDFLITNKELFHGDVPRGFLGFRRDFERLRNHYRSSFFAAQLLRGSEISDSDRSDYIDRRYTLRQRKFIGKVMLELNKSQPQAGLLQDVIESYRCHEVLRP